MFAVKLHSSIQGDIRQIVQFPQMGSANQMIKSVPTGMSRCSDQHFSKTTFISLIVIASHIHKRNYISIVMGRNVRTQSESTKILRQLRIFDNDVKNDPEQH